MGLVDSQTPTIQILSVPSNDGIGGCLIRIEFDEAESTTLATFAVSDDFGILDGSAFRKSFLQSIVIDGPRQIPYIQTTSHCPIPIPCSNERTDTLHLNSRNFQVC
jgi:hypothetical protein